MADMTPTSATEYGPSTWFGPYATNYLDKQQALSGMGFTPYTGQLTAGASDLQNQAFQGIGSLTLPSAFDTASSQAQQVFEGAGQAGQYNPNTFTTGTFDAGSAAQYMNPYLTAALQPQIQEAQRQAEQRRLADAARLTQAGAYGGSRQAIMESEGNRNLLQNLSNITGTGYANAYDKAMSQFNADQARQLQAQQGTEQSRQFGANLGLQGLGQQLSAANTMSNIGGQEAQYGLQNLQQQLAAGQTQRGITQEGLAADYAQYLREFNYPQEQLNAMGSAIKSIPAYTTFASNTYGAVPNALQSAVGGATGITQLLKDLKLI